MILPATPTLPEGVSAAFASQSLAGLGDDSTDLSSYLDAVMGTSAAPDDLSAGYAELNAMGPTVGPNATGTLSVAGQTLTYMDSYGNIVQPLSGGGYNYIGQDGSGQVYRGTPPPAAAAPSTMSPAQQAAVTAAISQTAQLLQMLALKPGTSVTSTPQGTTLSQQAAGFPLGTAAISTTGAVGSSILPIALIGALLLFMTKK